MSLKNLLPAGVIRAIFDGVLRTTENFLSSIKGTESVATRDKSGEIVLGQLAVQTALSKYPLTSPGIDGVRKQLVLRELKKIVGEQIKAHGLQGEETSSVCQQIGRVDSPYVLEPWVLAFALEKAGLTKRDAQARLAEVIGWIEADAERLADPSSGVFVNPPKPMEPLQKKMADPSQMDIPFDTSAEPQMPPPHQSFDSSGDASATNNEMREDSGPIDKSTNQKKTMGSVKRPKLGLKLGPKARSKGKIRPRATPEMTRSVQT